MTDPRIRDCFQQVKTIHHLMLRLADDLGDAAASIRGPQMRAESELRALLESYSDAVCDAETVFQKMREALEHASR